VSQLKGKSVIESKEIVIFFEN